MSAAKQQRGLEMISGKFRSCFLEQRGMRMISGKSRLCFLEQQGMRMISGNPNYASSAAEQLMSDSVLIRSGFASNLIFFLKVSDLYL